jgi:hypothetical protein
MSWVLDPATHVVGVQWAGFKFSISASSLLQWRSPEQTRPQIGAPTVSGQFIGSINLLGGAFELPHPEDPRIILASSEGMAREESSEEGTDQVCVARRYQLFYYFAFLQWNRVELEVYVHASEGTCRVRVNGALVIDFTGNTRNASFPEGIGYFSLRTASVGGTPGGGSYRFQDLLAWSGGDGMPNDFLGDFAIVTRTPNANGATVDGATVGAASAHQAVQTQDADASYQKLEQPGDLDLFQKSSIEADQVFGILVHAYVRADGPDVLPMKMLVRSGSTTYEHAGDLTTPGQAQYVGREAFFAVDPATLEAWTPAALNAAQFGYKWVA